MLIAPFATYLARRLGIHRVILSGSLLQCIGYVTASFAIRTWHLYLTQGLLVGCGIGLIIIPSTAILSQWFSKKRGIANGISSAGSGVGGAAFAWGTAMMIRSWGLGWALRTTGLIAFAATVIAALLLRDRNRHINPTQLAFDLRLLRHKAVVYLLLWAFVSMFGYITLLFSLSDFALSIGLSQSQATDIVGFLNLGTAIGRPIIGITSDRFSKTATAGSLTFLCGVICFGLWLPASSFGLTVFFSLICGAILGVFWMVCRPRPGLLAFSSPLAQPIPSDSTKDLRHPTQTIGPLSVEVAGLKNLQSMLSLAWAMIVAPTACKWLRPARRRRHYNC